MISTTASFAAYTATAGQTVFAYNFRVLTQSELRVYTETTAGVRSDITGSIVSVTGIDNEAGGSVTIPAQVLGTRVFVVRASVLSQLWDASSLNFFDPAAVERVVDRLTILAQENNSIASSAIRVAPGESLPPLTRADRKGKTLQFDANGDLELTDSAAAAAAAAQASAAAASASEAAAEAAQAAAEDARDVALGAMVALTTDVANYGASPSATASVNRAAFQAAFDAVEAAGGGTVIVTVPGTYLINDTLWYPGNFRLDCSEGVVLKRSVAYSEVLFNKGALTHSTISNVQLLNVKIDSSVGSLAYGDNMYGQVSEIGALGVSNLLIRNPRSTNLGSGQFFIQISNCRNFEVYAPDVYGHKDVVHLGGNTKHGIITFADFSNYDDAVGINAHDYPESSPYLGDIEDILIIGMKDRVYTTPYGYATRLYTGSWGAWTNGMSVQRGTTVVANGRIYQCINPNGSGPFTASASPTTTTIQAQQTTADGIIWLCKQAGTHTSASIRRVTWQGCRFENPRSGALVYADWSKDEWHQSVYPGTEAQSEITGLTMNGCSIGALGGTGVIFKGGANVKDVTLIGCTGLNGLATIFGVSSNAGLGITPPATTCTLTIIGCKFDAAMSNFLDLRRANHTTKLVAWGNQAPNAIFSNYFANGSVLQIGVSDLRVSTTGLTSIAGSLLFNGTGYSIASSDGGAYRPIARENTDVTFGQVTNIVADTDGAVVSVAQGSSSAYGWRWKLANGSTGDYQLYRVIGGTETLAFTFNRSSGNLTFAGSAVFDGATGKTVRITNGAANGSVATTLGSVGPTGATAGNPQGWMRISVNGTDRYIPYW